jgi:8-oxo-dGTP pyrophosphatase MutT (NUDIX family)
VKIKRIRAGSLILNNKNQLLLIFRKGKWDLPKGKVNKKRKLLSAAIEESIEETGLKKKHLRLIKPLKKSVSVKKNGVIYDYWFLFKYKSRKYNFKPQISEGIEECRWVNENDITKYYPYFRNYVCEVLEMYLKSNNKNKKRLKI